MNDIKNIYEECRNCKKCKIKISIKVNEEIVEYSGNEKADIMFIAQNPSCYRDNRGINNKIFLDDKIRPIFESMLKNVGLDFEDIYVTNLVKCSTKNNVMPSDDILENCKDFLLREIEIVRPKIIITVGKFASNYFGLKENNELKVEKGILYYSIYHPSFCNYGKMKIEEYSKQLLNIKDKIDEIKNNRNKFVQLHCHSIYSIRDGLCSPEEYVRFAYNNKLDVCSITDHGQIGGWIRQYFEAKKYGIKPIFGCELYINNYRNKLEYKDNVKSEDYKLFKKNNHIILLVKNKIGFNNLIKISSDAWINGFYFKPRTDIEFIKKHSEGLICLTSCLGGEISTELSKNNYDKAKEIALNYKQIFGDDLYIELLLIDLKEQIIINKLLCKLAKELGIKTVITNDCHYIEKEDSKIHDILLMIRDNKTMKDKEKNPDEIWQFKSKDLYYKNQFEMYRSFKDFYENEYFTEEVYKDSVKNVREIIDKVENIELDTSIKLPKLYDNDEEIFHNKLVKGWKEKGFDKLDEKTKKIYRDRVKYEEGIIKKLGFVGYFLILEDIINWAKRNNIYVGKARGSGAGSLVCYLLNITGLDPIKYGLLFERFMSEGREDPPDIDVDFSSDDRDKVVEYIFNRFSKEKTCAIGTYGFFKTRSAILDIGRVLNIPLIESLRLTRDVLTSDSDDMTIEEIENNFPEVKDYFDKYPEVKKILEKLRGKIRNISRHAAGIIISDRNLSENIALMTQKNNILSAWQEGSDYHELSKLGFVKFDILGLTNLSVIRDTLKLIKQRYNKDINLDSIDLNDINVYKKIWNGDTVGIFQFESRIARDLIAKIKPSNFNELIATNALLRPGPLRLGMHEDFAKRKFTGKYTIPKCLEDILKETYGIIVYQESIMLIAQKIANFDLVEANRFRKALVKYGRSAEVESKRFAEVESYKDKFINNATKFITREQAENLWKEMASFSQYGFNKCLAGNSKVLYYTNVKKGIVDEIEICELYKKFHSSNKSIYICSYIDGKLKPVKIKNVYDTGIKKCYVLKTRDNRQIISSADHKFLVFRNWLKLSELEKGMEITIFLRDFNIFDLDVVKEIKYCGKRHTYDIEVEDINHCYIANEFVVHNSHSCGYAMISYQEMWLKKYYFIEFMTALINNTPRGKEGKNTTSFLADYINYARINGINVLNPDINRSQLDFSILDDNTIIYGFNHIKNIGNLGQEIIKKRPFKSFKDFLDKVKCNKTKVEYLIYSGAFDSFDDRNELLKEYYSIKKSEENFVELSKKDLMKLEIDALKVYLSDKIFKDDFKKCFKKLNIMSITEFCKLAEGESYVYGMIESVLMRKTKKNKNMYVISLMDDYSKITFFAWDKEYKNNKELLRKDRFVVLKLKKDNKGRVPILQCNGDQRVLDLKKLYENYIIKLRK